MESLEEMKKRRDLLEQQKITAERSSDVEEARELGEMFEELEKMILEIERNHLT